MSDWVGLLIIAAPFAIWWAVIVVLNIREDRRNPSRARWNARKNRDARKISQRG